MVLTFEGYSEINNAGKGKGGKGGRRSTRKGTAAEARAMFGVYSRKPAAN